jgi:hypothetical protein
MVDMIILLKAAANAPFSIPRHRENWMTLPQILSGKELYGNELIAIRELLQNAFDAVREQVAYERLTKEGSLDTAWKEHLGKCIKWSYNLTWKIAEHG